MHIDDIYFMTLRREKEITFYNKNWCIYAYIVQKQYRCMISIMITGDEAPISWISATVPLKMINLLRNDRTLNGFINYDGTKPPHYMPELKLKQLQYESDTWKHLLGFMMDENIRQKNRLSEILKNGFNRNLLEEMEDFQTRFIKEDERIRLMRHELVELHKLLIREIYDDGKIIKEINAKFKNLRNNIAITERKFGELKLEFNNFLSENI